MISFPILCVILGTVAFLWHWSHKDKKGKRIPGPRGLPLIGSALELKKPFFKQFNKWQDEYGEIYKVNLGRELAIVISNPKMIKEMFMNDSNYVGRILFEGFEAYKDQSLGIVSSEGELWEVHRRFLLRQLRDFGFGKAQMEESIVEELNEVIRRFKESEGKPIKDIKMHTTLAVINSLWLVLSQKRFKHDDPELMEILEVSKKATDDIFSSRLLLFFPFLRHIAPDLTGYNSIRTVIDKNARWFEKLVDEHKKTYQEENIRDFIDIYLSEMYKTTDPNSTFYGEQAERQLVATLADLFFAGTDTTSTTLAWALLYLCKYPEVQKKFQNEIEKVTGNSRNVSVADRPNMPYTLALIDEVLRYSSIVPTGLQHRALQDKMFQGYFIPENALITPNLYYIHHEKSFWGDPQNFRPERFLSEDGKTYKKCDRLLPFEIGRRQCAGETLARDTIFLFLTNLLQRFSMTFDPSEPEPDMMELTEDIVLHPIPYSLIMKDRLV